MNIIITGASKGIGYATALEIATQGSHKIIAIARNKANLKKLANKCKKLNPLSEIYTLSIDLNKNIYSTVLRSFIKKNFSSNKKINVDILINNAGTLINKNFESLTNKNWIDIFNVNVFAVSGIIRTVLPFMGIGKKSHIINIGGMGGFQGAEKFTGLSAYSASKAALACLSECLAVEFMKKNIAVNCLALGAVQTTMLTKAFPGYNAPMAPNEIAKFIADFACNGHNFMNGKVLPVSFRS